MESIVRDIAHCLLRYNYVYSIVVVIYYNVFSLFTISFVDFGSHDCFFFFETIDRKLRRKLKFPFFAFF